MLKPGGRLIVSVDHPFVVTAYDVEAGRKPNYFASHKWTDEWTMGGQSAHEFLAPAAARDDRRLQRGRLVISEPAAALDTLRELLPDKFAVNPCFLCFLFFFLQAD